MMSYLLRRLWQMVPTLAGVVLGVFFLFKGFGGDPAENFLGVCFVAGSQAGTRQIDGDFLREGLVTFLAL